MPSSRSGEIHSAGRAAAWLTDLGEATQAWLSQRQQTFHAARLLWTALWPPLPQAHKSCQNLTTSLSGMSTGLGMTVIHSLHCPWLEVMLSLVWDATGWQT